MQPKHSAEIAEQIVRSESNAMERDNLNATIAALEAKLDEKPYLRQTDSLLADACRRITYSDDLLVQLKTATGVFLSQSSIPPSPYLVGLLAKVQKWLDTRELPESNRKVKPMNVRLMAAAPDLMEACKAAVELLENQPLFTDCQPAYGMLRGAINAAKGKP